MPYKDHERKVQYDRDYKEAHKLRGFCKTCGNAKENRYRVYCDACVPRYDKAAADKAYKANLEPAIKRTYAKRHSQKLRHEAIMVYGGYQCSCPGCDVTESHWLGLDHIEGGGNAHRASYPAKNIYFYLKKEGYPPGLRVMCHNCNLARGFYGSCPHQDILNPNMTPEEQLILAEEGR